MPTPIPWILALGATTLVALASKSKKAKAEPVTPQPVTGAPVGPGVNIPTPKPVPKTTLPPFIPPDAVEVPPPSEVEIITSPGQPVQPIKKKPKQVGEVLEDIGEVLDELPLDPGIIEQPISIQPPVARPVPIDLGELETIVVDVPEGPVIDIDDIPEGVEFLDASDLAVEVYNITIDGIRNLKGSEVRTIKAYQTEQGLKPDGLYGPDTAESLIQYGFVPASPWIWPKSGASQAKADWRDLTQDMANRDPQRADEWAEAGRV